MFTPEVIRKAKENGKWMVDVLKNVRGEPNVASSSARGSRSQGRAWKHQKLLLPKPAA